MALRDEAFVRYTIENEAIFRKTLERAAEKVEDLRIPFKFIAIDFHKSEKAIFKLTSPGGYPDLSPETKKQKQRQVGFLYPILKRSGRLESSLTDENDPEAIVRIGKKQLTIGTSTPYAVYHNSDKPRKKIPQRKIVFIGPESRAFHQKDRQNKGGRLTRWSNIIDGYVGQVFKKAGCKVETR